MKSLALAGFAAAAALAPFGRSFDTHSCGCFENKRSVPGSVKARRRSRNRMARLTRRAQRATC